MDGVIMIQFELNCQCSIGAMRMEKVSFGSELLLEMVSAVVGPYQFEVEQNSLILEVFFKGLFVSLLQDIDLVDLLLEVALPHR
jgi:hypothetical protein